MVARTPPLAREKRAVIAPLSPTLIRETLKKVDRCVARLQELQYTVSGGRKSVAGVSLSPRSTKGYIRTSLRCKQETLRLRNGTTQKSPPGKFPVNAAGDLKHKAAEWRRMSLPAMILGETVAEIQQATQFAKQAVVIASRSITTITADPDPKTPLTTGRGSRIKHRGQNDSPELRARRMREKQHLLRTIRTESHGGGSPTRPRARTRISFKASSQPLSRREATYRHVAAAHRVSPKNRPWVKRTTLLFPNPTFYDSAAAAASSSYSHHNKPRSPVVVRIRRSPPHKFIVRSPVTGSKLLARIKSPPPAIATTSLSPKTTTPKVRRSFSPAKLASRLMSPLKSRIASAYRRSLSSGGGVLPAAAVIGSVTSTPGGKQASKYKQR